MKQKVSYLIFSLIILTTVSGCVDYNDVTKEVNLRIQILAPSQFVNSSSLEGHTVTLNLNGSEQTAQTNAEGIAVFNHIVPDIYTISTSWELTAAEYANLTGDSITTTGCTVSGSINTQLISEDVTLTLSTHAAVNRDILISKVYYSGSKDKNNKNYIAGRYIELYNQSDNNVDITGLYIGLIETEGNPAYTLNNLHTVFNDSIVLLKQVFQIPTDRSYIVQPGRTTLIVNSAIDHSVNSLLENNLLQADFEAKDVTGKTQNNPEIKSLNLIYSTYPAISNMNLIQGGPCGIVIFRTTADVLSFGTTFSYGKTKGSEFLKLPKRYITDAVEILKKKNSGVDINSKRLYNDLDAGYTCTEATNGYTGEVVYRKTSRIVNGKRLLLDTNNSSNDFKVSTTIRIREYDE